MTPRQRYDLPLAKLAVPMFLENILRTTLSSADILMLSFYSEEAVAAVGLANTFSFFLTIMYTVVTAGASVLISQYLGAEREREAGQAALASYALALVFAITLSLAMFFGIGPILGAYDLSDRVRGFAHDYLAIVGGLSLFSAFNIVQSSILRSYGHAKAAMWSNMLANVINVIGNSIAIFGPLGLPKTGVAGVAASTVISQAVACLVLALHMSRLKLIKLPARDILSLPRRLYAKLLSVGAPVAGENLSYNVGQIVIGWIISGFGTAALSANTYAITILRFVFIPAFSIGNAGQIKTGYLVGAGRFDRAKSGVWRYYALGLAISASTMTLIYLLRWPIIRVFTQSAQTQGLLATLLFVSIFRESGRVANLVVIPGLKGSGDILFPVAIGVVFMWGLGVGGAYALGRLAGMGLMGVWIAIAADEWVRGILVCLRWQSGAWTKKSLVASH